MLSDPLVLADLLTNGRPPVNPVDPVVGGWEPRARALAERLAQDGMSGSGRRLHRAFEIAPRYVFVPRLLSNAPGRPPIDGADPATADQPLLERRSP